MENNKFQTYFVNKGVLGSIAEKAIHNFKGKIGHNKSQYYYNIYDFTIGHNLRQINKKVYFDYRYDEALKMELPFKHTVLLRKNFKFPINNANNISFQNDRLFRLIDNIRNINAHYVHIFDYVEESYIGEKLCELIIEAYKLALIQILFREKISSQEKKLGRFLGILEKDELFNEIYLNEKEQVNFLKKTHSELFPDNGTTSLNDVINHILFIQVEKDFNWQLGHGNKTDSFDVFTIKQGKYLSFHGALFFLNMFLYRNEANFITQKSSIIKNDKNKTEKLRLYIAFSKKFSSQDIDPNKRHLVYFRDMIQYLSKFPVSWNEYLEKHENESWSQNLSNYVANAEIDKKYETIIEIFPDFKEYAHNYLIQNQIDVNHNNANLYKDFIEKNDMFKKLYLDILSDNLPVKRADEVDINTIQLFINRYILKKHFVTGKSIYADYKNGVIKNDKNKDLKNRFEAELNQNLKLEKLKTKIKNNVLLDVYKRNKDSYLLYSLLFLLDCKYLDGYTQVKMYKFYYPDDENDFIETKKDEIDQLKKYDYDKYKTAKKEFDNLKYHKGKLVEFKTFGEVQNEYPSWTHPFVIQDNAITIKITHVESPIKIQKNLMQYLVEDALSDVNNAANKGNVLLIRYFNTSLKVERQNAIDIVGGDSYKLGELRKILPRRLVKKYTEPSGIINAGNHCFENLLSDTKLENEKYIERLKEAKEKGIEEEFVKQNKGKHFKFKFIHKTWQIMYFKPTYIEHRVDNHHKHFNINKEEFHDLMKWLYLIDTVPNYKENILALILSKGLTNDSELYRLIQSSHSIEQIYQKTVELFKKYILSHSPIENNEEKYSIKNYEKMKMFDKGNVHINIHHFREYLIINNYSCHFNESVEIARKSLIEEYYVGFEDKSIFEELRNIKNKDKYASEKKASINEAINLYNKLRNVRLQDGQIYRMALYFLKKDVNLDTQLLNTNITEILNQNFDFNINSQGQKMSIPFHQINKYEEIKAFNLLLEQIHEGSSILENLSTFVTKFKDEPSLKGIELNNLSLSDITKLTNTLILKQVKFTDLLLTLEEYFIWKDKIAYNSGHHNIAIDEIVGLHGYFNDDYTLRNRPFHFNFLAENNYDDELRRFEQKFYNEEVGDQDIANLNSMVKYVVHKFINLMHNHLNNVSTKEIAKYGKKTESEIKEIKKGIALNKYQGQKKVGR